MNLLDDLGIYGYLEISKLYSDGNEEIIFSDENVIVSGMGVNFSHFFTLSGSTSIVDYQFDRVQLGVSAGNQVSSTYELSGALSSISEYESDGSQLLTVSAYQILNGVVSNTKRPYLVIPFSRVTRIDSTSVRYTIVIDAESCNNITRDGSDASLQEIGLFAKNPRGLAEDASILVAYRTFSGIVKTSDFSLVFRWTLNL